MAKSQTPIEVIRARLQTAEGLDNFRRKIYDLRRLVAGDMSAMVPGPPAQSDGPHVPHPQQDLYDFIVLNWQEGRSNKLLQTTKTLLMQTAFHFPEIEFQDLPPTLATLNAQYCALRLGESPRGCNARDHMRMAGLDYMIAGLGWVKACVVGDRPAIVHCDTLDMTWDRTVRLPCEIRWASCRYREPLRVWVEMFGTRPFQQRLGSDPVGGEQVVELEWYYDLDGDQGTWCVLDAQSDAPIHLGPNPYFFTDQGRRQPFLPYEPCYLLNLPSLRVPMGLVEMMLPNQIAVWQAEDNIRLTLERGAPFYTVGRDALTPEEKQKFEDGELGAIVELNPNQGPLQPQAGIQVHPQVLSWRETNNLEIISQGGANPYAAGAPVQGVSYAAEVNAIQGQSGLMAGNIAKDLAAFWARTVRKFLAVASLYDDQPLTLAVEGADLQFGPQNPIRRFLRPDAQVVVKESTMQFKPQPQRIQEATLKLQTAMSVAQVFPNALPLAFQDWLVALGEKAPERWMSTDQPPGPMAPGPQGPPSGPPPMPLAA